MSNEDQEQSKTPMMEDSDVKTVEFLRARLLSERAISKSARQRADELAKRVSELEELLQLVSLQRKKAEKATADILAILENSGITDVSEDYYDSHSDNDDDTPTPRNFNSSNGSVMNKEPSKRINEADGYSGSEIESCSPSTGRSLSWKSAKDPQRSLEKKKYMESVRRRASFGSYSSSSARRIGKSCRKINRRSVEELQNEATEQKTYTKKASNCSNAEPVASIESSGYDTQSIPMENAALYSSGETQNVNAHYYSEHERDENMESALQRQAQLIGRYEEEEKAQREWEEKFRENNNSGAQDSCDPGNHSDVTEERYDMQSPKLSSPEKKSSLRSDDHHEIHKYPSDARVTEKSKASATNPYQSQANKGNLLDPRNCNAIAGEPSTPEFSFPMSSKKIEQDQQHKESSSANRCQPCLPVSTGYEGQGKLLHSSLGSRELALVPQATSSSNRLGSVLDALQQAKLSLNQQINRSSMVGKNKADLSKLLPIASPGLFRLPTDYQFVETSRSNHPGPSAQSTLANRTPQETPGIRFSSTPPFDSRIANHNNVFSTDRVTYRPFTYEMTPSFPSSPLNQHGFDAGPIHSSSSGPNYLNAYTSPLNASVSEFYPFLPDITLRIPLNELSSRTFPVSDGSGLPLVNTRASPLDDRARPNIYR